MDRNDSAPDFDRLDYEDFVKYDIPVTVYLSILCTVGVLGNIHVLVLYSKRFSGSPYQVFILTLAGVDFLACALCLPYEIVDIYKSYSFTDRDVCKFFRFLIHFTSAGSGLMLVLIAFERYRKLCTPFGRQIVGREIYVACAVVLALAFVVAVPSFSLYGIALKDVPDYPLMKGKDCRALKSFKHSFIYLAFILLLSTSMFVACAVMYSVIGRVLYIHFSRKKNQRRCIAVCEDSTDPSPCTKQSAITNNDNLQDSCSVSSIKSHEKGTLENSNDLGSTLHSPIKNEQTDKTKTSTRSSDTKSKVDSTMRITLMLLVATSVSYLGYIPAIISEIVKAADANALSKESSKAMNVLTRSFYLNNAVNPIVFFFMDRRLRKDAKKMYKKIWKKIKSC